MTFRQLIAGIATACLSLAANAAMQGRYDFNYHVDNASGVGIVRAFDDGKNTVLAFSNLASTAPSFTASDGSPIAFRAIDNYAVLPGIQHNVLIFVRGVTGHLQYGAPAATPVTPVAVETPSLPRPVPVLAPPPAPKAPVAANPLVTPINATGAAKTAPVAPAVATKPTTEAEVGKTTTDTKAKPSAAQTFATQGIAERPPVPAPVTPVVVYSIRAGQTLRQAVEQWAVKAGYKVVWQPDYAFDIEADASFPGDFITAVTALFDAYRQAKQPLFVDIYPSQHLVVVSASAEKAMK